MITGDESAKFLFKALYRKGYCNQPTSIHLNDGLSLYQTAITCVVKCAPPNNKPLAAEFDNCRKQHLLSEIQKLKDLKAILCLGKQAYDQTHKALNELYKLKTLKKPNFKHGAHYTITLPTPKTLWVFGSYHPSPQNTHTGVLTELAFLKVLEDLALRADLR
jgi:uracil-DNA glycosylase family 4